MARARTIPTDHKPLAGLPVRMVTVGRGAEQVAVHIGGVLGPGRVPVICIAGYNRNMADYSDFVRLGGLAMIEANPIVLVDLKGRGRSSDRPRLTGYSSLADADDLTEVARALAIERAIFVGQGYGGQVLMALAAAQPSLIAGTVLIDAGPVSDSRGLVRLRGTLDDLTGVRGEASLKPMLRRMLAADYPGMPEAALDGLAYRSHFVDRRGRLQPLFDPVLIKLLEPFDLDDVLVAQWPLFDALSAAPLMMMRTQLTQQLRRETFEEMMKRRRDAEAFVIEQQGSPALLDNADDVQPIADFVKRVMGPRKAAA
ncbi:MAG: alpha/beta fold hydrolase [Devosia nanyangense]|uniref:Alpha/beta fold hydrolase n=1 Tax=Devosia nanyangense TaxID=1228055 RepID=A0A933L231_9HYPH|nr:alpha/beta fold hydrolase [Devosia nanyangense]